MIKHKHGLFCRDFISADVSHSCGKKTGCTIGSWLALGFCPGIKASSGFLQRMSVSIACTGKLPTTSDFSSSIINSLGRFGYFKRSWKDFLSPVIENNLILTTDWFVKLLSGRPLQKKMCPWKLKNPEIILPTIESEVEQKKKEKKTLLYGNVSLGTERPISPHMSDSVRHTLFYVLTNWAWEVGMNPTL